MKLESFQRPCELIKAPLIDCERPATHHCLLCGLYFCDWDWEQHCINEIEKEWKEHAKNH